MASLEILLIVYMTRVIQLENRISHCCDKYTFTDKRDCLCAVVKYNFDLVSRRERKKNKFNRN